MSTDLHAAITEAAEQINARFKPLADATLAAAPLLMDALTAEVARQIRAAVTPPATREERP
jgi:hypothetical protein